MSAYAASGNRAEAQKVLDRLQAMSAQTYVATCNVAVIRAGLDDKAQAFAFIERAFEQRSYVLAVYLNTDERLESLRADPRFADLRPRIGLPEIH